MTAAGSAKKSRINFSEVASYTATAPVGGDTWVHIPAVDQPLPSLPQGEDAPIIGNNYGASSIGYPTVKGPAGLQWQTPVYTGTLGLDGTGGDSNPSACYAQKLLESYFGAASDFLFKGTTVGAASGAGRTAPLVVAAATNLAVGMAIKVGSENPRFITAISGTDISLNADLSASPSNGTVVYGAFNFKPTLGEYAPYLYLNVERDGHGWMLGAGKVNSLALQNLAAGGGLRYAMGFEGSTFVGSVSISSFVPNAFTGQPVVANGGEVIFDTASVCITDGNVNFGANHVWRLCATGTEGRDGFELVSVEGVEAQVTEYYAGARWTQYAARTGIPIMLSFEVGSTAAAQARGSVAVFFPNATVMPAEGVAADLVAQTCAIKAHMPTTAQITAGLTSPVYYAVFGGN